MQHTTHAQTAASMRCRRHMASVHPRHSYSSLAPVCARECAHACKNSALPRIVQPVCRERARNSMRGVSPMTLVISRQGRAYLKRLEYQNEYKATVMRHQTTNGDGSSRQAYRVSALRRARNQHAQAESVATAITARIVRDLLSPRS